MIKRFILLFAFLLLQITVYAQSMVGVVHDIKGGAVAGASVYLLNTGYSTSTNADGKFSIKNIPQGKYTIRISALSYASLIKKVSVDNGGAQLSFQLNTADKQLDEVVVTAQKRDEDAQKLPLSISTFSAKQVEDYKLWNSKDITAIIPNLYSANPGDNRNVTSIRGITTTSYDPAVVTYVDGVNQFGLDTYIAQLEDVERIEVLRGPQGTLYGRNAMGGVINIVTKQPTNDTHGFAEIDFGNYKGQRYNIGLRTPLIKDKLFFGASMLFTKQNGFYTNQFTGLPFDDQHSLMGNYYLKYIAGTDLSITLNVKHVENRNNGAFPLASDPVTALSDPFTVNQNNTTTLIDNIFNSSLSVQYSGRAFNFTSQSAYQSNYRYYTTPIDGDFSPIDAISLINNYGSNYNKVKVGTQEFRFTSPAASQSNLKWIAGIYGFYEDNPVKQTTHFGNDAALVQAPSNLSSINTNLEKRYGAAIFGQTTYTINPQLDLTLGLRYDYEHNRLNIEGEAQPNGQPAVVIRTDTASDVGFKAFSPKAGINYHVNTNSDLYAVYSKGFRAGGISELSSDPTQPPLFSYDPESSNNYEIGTKNNFWNQRIRLNASLFYTLVNNAQVPTLILPDANTVTRNAGKLKSKGAELELNVKPFKGLEADYNFGYTHARYTSLNVGANGSSTNLDGNHQIFTPDVTSALALQYDYNLGSTQNKLVVRGEWRYLGDQYFDLANQIKQNAYSLFNTRIGVSTKKLEFFLWGANLFNKHYIDYAYDFGATHLGNPKTYGASIRTNF
jgi:iron complex outermembrane receptor protein